MNTKTVLCLLFCSFNLHIQCKKVFITNFSNVPLRVGFVYVDLKGRLSEPIYFDRLIAPKSSGNKTMPHKSLVGKSRFIYVTSTLNENTAAFKAKFKNIKDIHESSHADIMQVGSGQIVGGSKRYDIYVTDNPYDKNLKPKLWDDKDEAFYVQQEIEQGNRLITR